MNSKARLNSGVFQAALSGILFFWFW